MKERQIPFKAPMVRAILAGQKTQTRRVVKPQPVWVADPSVPFRTPDADPKGIIYSPYGQPGDRLWVRETWRIGAWREDDGRMAIDYAATPEICRTPWVTIPGDHDGEIFNRYWMQNCDELNAKGVQVDGEGNYVWEPGAAPLRWRPSIHMPRWASRILLEVISVRVERLHDISEADAIAEGAAGGHGSIPGYGYSATPIEHYRHLWESLNGSGSWAANPWVWVVEFKRVSP